MFKWFGKLLCKVGLHNIIASKDYTGATTRVYCTRCKKQNVAVHGEIVGVWK